MSSHVENDICANPTYQLLVTPNDDYCFLYNIYCRLSQKNDSSVGGVDSMLTYTHTLYFTLNPLFQGWLKSAILGRGSSYKDLISFGLKSRGVSTWPKFPY